MSTTSRPQSALPERIPPLAALGFRDFRLLWVGEIISTIGTQMRIVAVNYHVYHLAKDSGDIDPAFALGMIGLVNVIPIIVTALLSGMVADSVSRRTVMLYTAIASLITSAVLALMSGLEHPSLWVIYALIAIGAVSSAFEMPARQAIVPSLVPRDYLPNALSLNVIAWQVATIVGPSLGGILIAQAGVTPVYWIDAISFLAVVVSVLLMRLREVRTSSQPVSVQAAVEGLKFVFTNPIMASTMLLDFFATFFGAAMTLLPLFADKVLHVGALELGWMYAAPSAGAVLAAAALTSIKIRRQGAVLLWAVALFGVCTAVFGVSQWLPLSLLALAGVGASDTVSMVIRQTIRQLMTPDELRGRMVSVNMIFFAGGPQLGEFESGALASLLGGPAAVLAGGLLCVVVVGLVAWRVLPLRRYHSTQTADAA